MPPSLESSDAVGLTLILESAGLRRISGDPSFVLDECLLTCLLRYFKNVSIENAPNNFNIMTGTNTSGDLIV